MFGSLAVGLSGQLFPRTAGATFVRGMSLPELVGHSQHVLIGTPRESRCVYLVIGGRRMLVTETQLRVEAALALVTPRESVILVRTLGGQLDGVGELVHGQAELRRGQLCAGFFERGPDEACWVTGMAQGHYPIHSNNGTLLLRASAGLPAMRDWERSAVKQLNGARLADAERLVAEAISR